MLTLSVRQPHANRLASGEKPAEFRSWRTKHRGDLLIASSLTRDPGAKDLPRGVTICVVEVYYVSGEPGNYAWHVRNPRRVMPVPILGKLGFFHVPDHYIFLSPIIFSEFVEIAPYTFAAGARRVKDVPGVVEMTLDRARATAIQLAVERQVPVWIRRNGRNVTVVGPEDVL